MNGNGRILEYALEPPAPHEAERREEHLYEVGESYIPSSEEICYVIGTVLMRIGRSCDRIDESMKKICERI